MASIGFTTGGLYRSGIAMDKIIELYLNSGTDTIELSFGTPKELFEYNLSDFAIENLKKFKSVSIHAPFKEVKYEDNDNTHKIIKKLKELYNSTTISGFVLHPDTIDNFEILAKSDLPFLIENMDGRKTIGTHPEYFAELKQKYNFGFVLDIQHAYEHDHTMNIAKEFIEVMGDRLKHMHVSGWTNVEIHVPVYRADNKEAITKILELNINVPKILEGTLLEDINNNITKELEYVSKYNK